MNKQEFEFLNNKNERVVVWLSTVEHDRNYKKNLMNIWLKNGYVDRFIEKTINCQTFVYDELGNCWGKYNPTSKLSADKCRMVINFDYILEDTLANRQLLLDKVQELSNNEE